MGEPLALVHDLACRDVGERMLVLHVPTAKMFELNPTARILWEALAAGASVEGLEQLVAAEFGLPRDRAAVEVEAFVAALGAAELLQTES
jgi:Coenzyme PQQ synthesis protein D (PqqD)